MDSGAEGYGAGPWSSPVELHPAVQKICVVVKSDVERKTGKDYKDFAAIVFRSQFVFRIVTGTNYLIKVHVGGEDYVHILVFEAFPPHSGKLSLNGVQTGKTLDDPLVPFE